MKRILFLAAVLLSMGMGAMAQSAKSALQFVDDKGNVIADGAVFEVTEVTVDTDFGTTYMKPHLFVKNVAPQSKTVAVKLDFTSMPYGNFQCCVGQCKTFEEPSVEMSDTKAVNSGESLDIQAEWFPTGEANSPTTWIATLTTGYAEQTNSPYGVPETKMTDEGPSVKVKFVYGPTGVASVKDSNATVTEVERYNIQGQKMSKPCKGINIIKLSNGKTVKKLMQ